MDKSDVAGGDQPSVADTVAHLAAEFGPLMARDSIDRILDETVSDFRSARAPAYVPVLVERLGRQRLVAWLKAQGPACPAVPAGPGQVRQT